MWVIHDVEECKISFFFFFFLSQLASADSIKLIQVFVESSVVTIYVVL